MANLQGLHCVQRRQVKEGGEVKPGPRGRPEAGLMRARLGTGLMWGQRTLENSVQENVISCRQERRRKVPAKALGYSIGR